MWSYQLCLPLVKKTAFKYVNSIMITSHIYYIYYLLCLWGWWAMTQNQL